MKKRILALFLILSLLVGMVPVSYAEPTLLTNYGLQLEGVEGTGTLESDTTVGLNFLLKAKGASTGYPSGAAGITLVVDTTKLMLVRATNSSALTISAASTGFPSITNGARIDADNWDWVSSAGVLGRWDQTNNKLYLSIQPSFTRASNWTDYKELALIRFAYVNGKTKDDLDASSVRLASIEETAALGGSNVAVIPSKDAAAATAGNKVQYGVTSYGSGAALLPKPAIIYPNSDVINLNGVKVEAANRYVNVPKSMPTAEADVTVTATAKGYYTADCQNGTEIAGVPFTFSAKMKDGSALPGTVLIDPATGTLTVKAGAPQDVVTITAEGTHTNIKGVTATKTGTFDVNLRHGDAGQKETEDPTKPDLPPGNEPDTPAADKVLSGVAIYEGTTQLVTSATGSTYSKDVAIPATGGAATTITLTGKAVDQFGDAITGAGGGSWSIQKDGASYAGADPAFTNGTLTVNETSAQGNYAITYTEGTYSATATFNVSDTAITWPVLTNSSIVYGQDTSDIAFDATTGSVVSNKAAITDVSFTWKAAQSFDTDSTKAIMECTYSADGTPIAAPVTHDYTIAVNKANQQIVIDPAIVVEGLNTLNIEWGEASDLKAKVINSSVKKNGEFIASTNSLQSALTPAGTDLVTWDAAKTTVTGNRLSTSGTDVAMLTFSAGTEDSKNYNPATAATYELYVQKPVLKASIVFDTTTPTFGQKITATITEHAAQVGSLTADLNYQWGKMVDKGDGNGLVFEALTSADTSGPLGGATSPITPGTPATATVEYTPAVADVGATLALQVTTPSDSATYKWIHSVTKAMDAAVAKATFPTPTIDVTGKNYNSITLKGVEGAAYALAVKGTPLTATIADGAPTLTWANVNATKDDVKFTEAFDGTATPAALQPITEYTVYMKMLGTDTHDEANAAPLDVKTSQIAATEIPQDPIPVDPDGPDGPLPPVPTPQPPIPADVPNISATIAIDETDGLVYNKTLTAKGEDANQEPTVTDGRGTYDAPITSQLTSADFVGKWDYQWYRVVTPAVADDPETTEVDESKPEVVEAIAGATQKSYTLTADDIGKTIKLKVSTKDSVQYGLVAMAATSDVIAKEPGDTLAADGFATTPATDAATTDGSITIAAPADDTLSYEYRLKVTSGAENAWTDATITSGVFASNLGIGTYEIRVKGTDTKEASNIIEIEVKVAGYNITGKVFTFNAKNPVTYSLYKKLESGEYETTAAYTGTAVAAEATTEASQLEQTFTITAIADGTYRMVLSKDTHLDFTINGVVINGADLDLTQNAKFTQIYMVPGDIDGNKVVNLDDLNLVADPGNYYNPDLTTAPNPNADIDGNGQINLEDMNIVALPDHYFVQGNDAKCTVDFN